MVSFTRNITISSFGMPAPMLPMGGFCAPAPAVSIFSSCPPMISGCYGGFFNSDMMAGYCLGSMLAMPGVLNTIGKGLKWGYNNILKPVGQFLWNDVLKPVGNGLKWVWDHTLGWVLKKVFGSSKKSKAENDV